MLYCCDAVTLYCEQVSRPQAEWALAQMFEMDEGFHAEVGTAVLPVLLSPLYLCTACTSGMPECMHCLYFCIACTAGLPVCMYCMYGWHACIYVLPTLMYRVDYCFGPTAVLPLLLHVRA